MYIYIYTCISYYIHEIPIQSQLLMLTFPLNSFSMPKSTTKFSSFNSNFSMVKTCFLDGTKIHYNHNEGYIMLNLSGFIVFLNGETSSSYQIYSFSDGQMMDISGVCQMPGRLGGYEDQSWSAALVRSQGRKYFGVFRGAYHIWVCLKIGYIPNYSHLTGIMIINHWV